MFITSSETILVSRQEGITADDSSAQVVWRGTSWWQVLCACATGPQLANAVFALSTNLEALKPAAIHFLLDNEVLEVTQQLEFRRKIENLASCFEKFQNVLSCWDFSNPHNLHSNLISRQNTRSEYLQLVASDQ